MDPHQLYNKFDYINVLLYDKGDLFSNQVVITSIYFCVETSKAFL